MKHQLAFLLFLSLATTAVSVITLADFISAIVSTAAYCKGMNNGKAFFAPERDPTACANAGATWTVDPSMATESQFQALVSAADPSGATTGIFLARVAPGFTVTSRARNAWRKELGVRFKDIIPTATYTYFLVFGTGAQLASMRTAPYFSDVITVPSALKLSPDLATKLENLPPSGVLDIDIGLSPASMETYPGGAPALAKVWQSALDNGGISQGKFAAESNDLITLKGLRVSDSGQGAGIVSSQPEAMFMEPKQNFTTSNRFASWITQSNVADQRPIWANGLTGEGEVVGVADSGLDVSACFFADPARPFPPVAAGRVVQDAQQRKVVQYAAWADGGEGETGGHGTHVCGSVAGNSPNAAESPFNGMASGAKLAFYDIGLPGAQGLDVPPSLETQMFPFAYRVGARIHTNSWGANSNSYSNNARSVDVYSWQNQDFLVLFAAGNSGAQGPGSIGTPATAKNCLTVGASQSSSSSFASLQRQCPTSTAGGLTCQDSVALFSSIGPLFDGRIKPDVVAPGFFIISAQSLATPRQCAATDQRLTQMAGTSMATPVTAGNAALVRQYFREGWYPSGTKQAAHAFIPMGALMKAMLINSGSYVKGTWRGNQLGAEPSMVQGFGRVDLSANMAFVAGSTPAVDLAVVGDFGKMKTLDQGQEHSYTVLVTPTTSLKKAADGKGSAGVLPLKITLVWHDPPANVRATKALINNLDLTVTTETGQTLLPNGRTAGADTINNVEQVVVKQPQPQQTYTITIKGAGVAQGPQPYALVVSGSFARNSTVFGGVAPTVTASTLPLAASATSLLIKGTGFSAVPTENAVTLDCAAVKPPGGGGGGGGTPNPTPTPSPAPPATGTQPIRGPPPTSGTPNLNIIPSAAGPTVTVTASDATSLSLSLPAGWACGAGPLRASVRVNGFGTGAFTQVATVSASNSASDTAAAAACTQTSSKSVCDTLSACSFSADGGCVARERVTAGGAVGITLLVAAVVGAALFGVYRWRTGGGMPSMKRPAGGASAAAYGSPSQAAGNTSVAMANASRQATPPPPPAAQPRSGALPAGWQAFVDEATGATYYYNSSTNSTQWVKPS